VKTLDPISREYFDIRLFAVMARASVLAQDDLLGEIFWNAMMTLGSEYPCNGQKAIDEGDAFVHKIIEFYKISRLKPFPETAEIAMVARSLLSLEAQDADLSGLRTLGERKMAEGTEGVTQEGIDELDTLVRTRLDRYKEVPRLDKWL
jgi:hypothetical protein